MIKINTYLVVYENLPWKKIFYKIAADTEDKAIDKMLDKLLEINIINYSVGYIGDEINVYRLDDLEIIE